MLSNKLTGISAALVLTLLFPIAYASDLVREQRLADEIVDNILDGEPVMLKAGDHDFLATGRS